MGCIEYPPWPHTMACSQEEGNHESRPKPDSNCWVFPLLSQKQDLHPWEQKRTPTLTPQSPLQGRECFGVPLAAPWGEQCRIRVRNRCGFGYIEATQVLPAGTWAAGGAQPPRQHVQPLANPARALAARVTPEATTLSKTGYG